MNRYAGVSCLVLLILFCSVFADFNRDAIKRSHMHYYGHSVSHDVNEATDHAVQSLSEQIAVHVVGSFEQKVKEEDGRVEENVKSVLKTHTTATLRNVRKDVRPLPDGRYDVFCYISREEVEEIFDERRQLIADIVAKANDLEQQNNIAHALKNYYFSSILIHSLPESNVKYGGINYTTEIPDRIHNIIENVKFTFLNDTLLSEKEREITLKATYKEKPVSVLDFTFWDGTNQVSVQAKDGLATFRLVGASVNFEKLKIHIKYSYYNYRNENQVVANLWSVIDRPEFITQKEIRLIKSKMVKEIEQEDSPEISSIKGEHFDFNLRVDSIDDSLPSSIVTETNRFLKVLESGDFTKVQNAYSGDAYLIKKIKNYIRYNNPQPLDHFNQGHIHGTENGWELRGIRVLQHYQSINSQTNEILVLDFDKKGRLYDFNLTMIKNLYKKFVKQAEYGKDWQNRHEIIKFLEKYRTAYLVRDIETVDMMFAEDALIIVGRKVQRKIMPEKQMQYKQFSGQPDYDYIRLSKQEYLKRQKRVFQSQEDICLQFNDFDIIRKNITPNIYGVEMRQSYASTSYADEGYLFLLVDFNDIDPIIHVRAWQPNEWDKDKLIKTNNFKVYN